MRLRIPLSLLVIGLAASAILSVYLWLRVLGSSPVVTPSTLALAPAERRAVAALPEAVASRRTA